MNYDYVEYLSPWYLKKCPIDSLFVHLHSENELHEKFTLNGVKFNGCDHGRARAKLIFPESRENAIERIRNNI